MAQQPPKAKPAPFLGDLAVVWKSRRQIWRLLSRADKIGFGSGLLIMAAIAFLENQIPLLLGNFFDGVKNVAAQPEVLRATVFRALAILTALYLGKESLQLVRRWMVSRTNTRIEAETTVRLVGHLLKIDLGALARERVGSLHGRISRSVEGFVKFLRVVLADFLPALLTAGVAIYYGLTTNWKVGLVMISVMPVSLIITIWQVSSQKGIRQSLLRAKEDLDGTVVEQLGGLEYVRAANTYAAEVKRIETAAEARRAREMKHGQAMARFDWAKSVNEGLFHVAIIGYAIVLASHGEIDYGKVITFSLLYLNIARPLKEVHRILDETYDSSQQVSVLLEMLGQPVDKSFGVVTMRPPRLDGSIPLLECQDLVADYTTPDGDARRILNGLTLEIRQGQTIGIAGRSGSGK